MLWLWLFSYAHIIVDRLLVLIESCLNRLGAVLLWGCYMLWGLRMANLLHHCETARLSCIDSMLHGYISFDELDVERVLTFIVLWLSLCRHIFVLTHAFLVPMVRQPLGACLSSILQVHLVHIRRGHHYLALVLLWAYPVTIDYDGATRALIYEHWAVLWALDPDSFHWSLALIENWILLHSACVPSSTEQLLELIWIELGCCSWGATLRICLL